MNESLQNLKGMLKDNGTSDGSLASNIRWFIEHDVDDGQTFTNHDIHTVIHTSTLHNEADRTRRIRNVSTILSRIRDDGLIEKVRGGSQGIWKKRKQKAPIVDWWNASGEIFNVWLPLEITSQVKVYPKNIILASGGYNAGKSGFCLKTAIKNMDKHEIDFLVSEMGRDEFKVRVDKCRLTDEELAMLREKVTVMECSHSFEDLVEPDRLTLIDYLSAPLDEAYIIKNTLDAIHEKLTTGVCVISLHKDYGKDYSYGGQRVYDAPRIVVTLENGVAKLVKAKNWATENNPNGKVMYFKLVQGHEFMPQGTWHHKEDEEDAGIKKTYWGRK